MGHPDLFEREGVGEVRDPLDRHYTPYPAAAQIVERVARFYEAAPAVVVEPSVGGGNFIRAAKRRWPDCYTIGVDIDDGAEGLSIVDLAIVGDWEEKAEEAFKAAKKAERTRIGQVLALGNTPFKARSKKQRERCINHVKLCLTNAQTTCLILPWAVLGGVDAWSPIVTGRHTPRYAWPIAPRPWGDHVRETAAFMWRDAIVAQTMVWPLTSWR